jgi:hypothetical protein
MGSETTYLKTLPYCLLTLENWEFTGFWCLASHILFHRLSPLSICVKALSQWHTALAVAWGIR